MVEQNCFLFDLLLGSLSTEIESTTAVLYLYDQLGCASTSNFISNRWGGHFMNDFYGVGSAISVVGPEARSYLHSQLSQDVVSLSVGEASSSLVLEPNGHVVCVCEVLRFQDDGYYVICDPNAKALLLARLSRYLIRTKAVIQDSGWVDLVEIDRDKSIAAETLGPSATSDLLHWRFSKGDHPEAGSQDDNDFLALRVLARLPRFGLEYETGALPNLFGDLRRFASFSKGCYTGQELVERVDSRGTAAPQVIYSAASDSLEFCADSILLSNGKNVGKVLSVASMPKDVNLSIFDELGDENLSSNTKLGFVRLGRGIIPGNVTLISDAFSQAGISLSEI